MTRYEMKIFDDHEDGYLNHRWVTAMRGSFRDIANNIDQFLSKTDSYSTSCRVMICDTKTNMEYRDYRQLSRLTKRLASLVEFVIKNEYKKRRGKVIDVVSIRWSDDGNEILIYDSIDRTALDLEYFMLFYEDEIDGMLIDKFGLFPYGDDLFI